MPPSALLLSSFLLLVFCLVSLSHAYPVEHPTTLCEVCLKSASLFRGVFDELAVKHGKKTLLSNVDGTSTRRYFMSETHFEEALQDFAFCDRLQGYAIDKDSHGLFVVGDFFNNLYREGDIRNMRAIADLRRHHNLVRTCRALFFNHESILPSAVRVVAEDHFPKYFCANIANACPLDIDPRSGDKIDEKRLDNESRAQPESGDDEVLPNAGSHSHASTVKNPSDEL